MVHSVQASRIRDIEKLEVRTLLHAAALFDGEEVSEGEPYEIVADFSLLDVNPTSSTFNQLVSPRDFDSVVSAWYFGRST